MASFQVGFAKNGYSLRYSGYRHLTQQEERILELYRKDPWSLLLSFGCIQDLPAGQESLQFLYDLAEDYVQKARQAGQVPVYDTSFYHSLAHPASLLRIGVNESWVKMAWKRLSAVLEKSIKAHDRNLEASLQPFALQLLPDSSLTVRLKESGAEDHPFDLEVRWMDNSDEYCTQQPVSALLDPEVRISHSHGKVMKNLLELSRKHPLFATALYQGSLPEGLPLSASQGYQFLKNASSFRSDTVAVEIPASWNKDSTRNWRVDARLQMQKQGSLFSASSLIAMRPNLSLNGQTLSREEMEEVLGLEDGLYYIKGQWTEVNAIRIRDLHGKMTEYSRNDLSVYDALRMESGIGSGHRDSDVEISNDQWLDSWLKQLRHPKIRKDLEVPANVHASLFPYQQAGYSWLDMMRQIDLGACLADDMGLGKTLQVLTLLDHQKQENPAARSLIIVPASLLVNWKKEAGKFTPDLTVTILHGSAQPVLETMLQESESDVVLTTYGTARKLEVLSQRVWDYLILDEAQAIKNPSSKQTQAVKKIPARHKLALTGTPIENDLTNLWSIFDFLNKGLLGSQKQFRETVKQMNQVDPTYSWLSRLVQPFLLRRLKTDKAIIHDLPDKIEKTEYVSLSKRQTALYLAEISRLEKALKDKNVDPIARKGRVLAALTHFKQICNHPDQFLDKDVYKPADSGKFEVLRDICETIRDNRECVLIFTQYREIIPHLDAFLKDIFGAPGMAIHGSVPVRKRQELVDAFNAQETYIPYMILSLKAGGTGLNLTRASHVIHFDRWWNPAVENQATDRAYRIGQQKNVVVHKFITTGTIEEHIDTLIESKKELAENIIGSGADKWITEMNDQELLNLVRLS